MKVLNLILYIFINAVFTGCSDSSTIGSKTIPSKKEALLTSVAEKKPAHNSIVWHWENRFEKEEVFKIKKWLKIVDQSVVKTFGKYPFEIHFYVHRSKSGNEPVPWAHTTRGKNQGVHFHVNTDYSLEEFLNDWTAQHEISHLSIPFVGKENAWFSEGYATYMQCQVMMEQRVMTIDEVNEKYALKLRNCKAAFNSDLPFPHAADSLKKAWNYPAMYWGGVSFFWKLNKLYKTELNQNLTEVITQYVSCCRISDSSPEGICLALDTITKTKIASQLLGEYQTKSSRFLFSEF